MSLARKVAQEAQGTKRGRGIGVVVVDPALASVGNDDDEDLGGGCDNGIVAVAGDARYIAPGIVTDPKERGENNPDCEGGPEFHAIMRAVEMVALRRRADIATTTTPPPTKTDGPVHNPPLSPLEAHYLYRPTTSTNLSTSPANANANTNRILPRSAGGYLCTDLDIYITHEPCLTCSMGILLSRFRAVTFPRGGRLRSGGLTSCSLSSLPRRLREGEDGDSEDQIEEIEERGEEAEEEEEEEETRDVYYGLHWRAELNWRAMCFEFIRDGDAPDMEEVEEAGDYYA
jgi:tRNA-specific adenosine deaminase 3